MDDEQGPCFKLGLEGFLDVPCEVTCMPPRDVEVPTLRELSFAAAVFADVIEWSHGDVRIRWALDPLCLLPLYQERRRRDRPTEENTICDDTDPQREAAHGTEAETGVMPQPAKDASDCRPPREARREDRPCGNLLASRTGRESTSVV